MNDRRTRQFFLYGVLAIGFLLPVVFSVGVMLGWFQLHPAARGRFIYRVIYQIAGLLSLYLALRYQGRKLKDIGLFFDARLLEIGRALALFFGVLFLTIALYVVPILYVPWLQRALLTRVDPSAALFGVSAGFLPVLWVFLNPFHEELLVRAFLITEMKGVYHSTLLAVVVSVALQTSYHLYQGLPAALIHVPTSLVFSWYYVRSRRIVPVILAHLFLDVSALAIYANHHW